MTCAASTTSPRSDRIPWSDVILLTMAAFSSFLTSTVVMVIVPKMMQMLGVGTYRIAWVANIYLIASGLIVPVSGYLGDRLGMKRLFLLSLAVFVAGSLFCGMANDLDTLLVARFIQALGGGLLMPVSNAIILRIVPPLRLGTAMGFRGIAVSAAPSLGPLLGAYMTDRLGWHAVFLMNVPVGILMFLLIYFLLPEVKGYDEPSLDYMGLIFSGVMLFTSLLALSEGQKVGWTSLYIVSLFTVSFFFLLLFVIWELNTENPLLDLRLFKNSYFAVSMFIAVVATVGMYSAVYFTPLFAENLLHYTLVETGLLLLPAGLVQGIMSPVAGYLFDRIGALPLTLTGMVVASLITLKMSFITTNTSFHTLMWLLIWRSAGLGLALFPLSIGALYTVPRRLAGRATAINSIVRMVPASMGLAYFTFVLNREEAVHYANMAAGLNVFSPASQFTLNRLDMWGSWAGYAGGSLHQLVLALENMSVQTQALARSIDDLFYISGFFLLASIPFTLFLSKKRMQRARDAEEARLQGGI